MIGDIALQIRQKLVIQHITSKCCPPLGSKKFCQIQIMPTIFRSTLGNNYCLQIIETGYAEQFYATQRMGLPSISLKITARIA